MLWLAKLRFKTQPDPVPVLLQEMQQWITDELANTHPAVFFVAMALLPLGPFPASLLFIMAGVRFGTSTGFLAGVAALALNMSLGYWLAQRVFRMPLERWLVGRGHSIPQFDPKGELRFLLLFRVTPGMPLFLQNYVLGLAGVRFRLYLPVSLAAQAPYVLGFVWFGQSLTQTSAWKIGLAAGGIMAAILAVSLLRRLLAKPKPPAAD